MTAIQHLHNHGISVTADGQQLLVSPRERLDDQLRGFISARKPELLEQAKQWAQLEAAINDYAKDDEEHWLALISDCRDLALEDWPWFERYFLQII